MAEIYLFHPKHGVKIATMELEAQHDEMYGWTRFEPEDLLAEAPVDEPAQELSVDIPPPFVPTPVNEMAPKRRGRPRNPEN